MEFGAVGCWAQPPPSIEQLSAARDNLLADAALRIAPLQDAVDIGDASAAEEAQLLSWKQYRVALNRLDLTVIPVAWPQTPEAWPQTPET